MSKELTWSNSSKSTQRGESANIRWCDGFSSCYRASLQTSVGKQGFVLGQHHHPLAHYSPFSSHPQTFVWHLAVVPTSGLKRSCTSADIHCKASHSSRCSCSCLLPGSVSPNFTSPSPLFHPTVTTSEDYTPLVYARLQGRLGTLT